MKRRRQGKVSVATSSTSSSSRPVRQTVATSSTSSSSRPVRQTVATSKEKQKSKEDVKERKPVFDLSKAHAAAKSKLEIEALGDKHVLSPLANKIRMGGRSIKGLGALLKKNYDDFTEGDLYNKSQQQLANFIVKNLAKDSNFKGIILRDMMETDPRSGSKMDSYGFLKKIINLSREGIQQTADPFTTITHEGTHALDDLFMRTYQKDALPWLAKNLRYGENTPKKKVEGGKDIGNGLWLEDDNGDWYREAQNILPIDNFKTNYKFKDAERNIKNSITNLDRAAGNKGKKGGTDVNYDYEGPVSDLEKLRTQDKIPDNKLFSTLSEFPAFAMESLHKKWNIEEGERLTPQKNLGRQFLKKMVKGVRRNFHVLEPDFVRNLETNKIEENFVNRLAELRNQEKYPGTPGANAYKQYLELTAGLNPEQLKEAEGIRHRITYSDTFDKDLIPDQLYNLELIDLPKRWAHTAGMLERLRDRRIGGASSSSSSSSSSSGGGGGSLSPSSSSPSSGVGRGSDIRYSAPELRWSRIARRSDPALSPGHAQSLPRAPQLLAPDLTEPTWNPSQRSSASFPSLSSGSSRSVGWEAAPYESSTAPTSFSFSSLSSRPVPSLPSSISSFAPSGGGGTGRYGGIGARRSVARPNVFGSSPPVSLSSTPTTPFSSLSSSSSSAGAAPLVSPSSSSPSSSAQTVSGMRLPLLTSLPASPSISSLQSLPFASGTTTYGAASKASPLTDLNFSRGGRVKSRSNMVNIQALLDLLARGMRDGGRSY